MPNPTEILGELPTTATPTITQTGMARAGGGKPSLGLFSLVTGAAPPAASSTPQAPPPAQAAPPDAKVGVPSPAAPEAPTLMSLVSGQSAAVAPQPTAPAAPMAPTLMSLISGQPSTDAPVRPEPPAPKLAPAPPITDAREQVENSFFQRLALSTALSPEERASIREGRVVESEQFYAPAPGVVGISPILMQQPTRASIAAKRLKEPLPKLLTDLELAKAKHRHAAVGFWKNFGSQFKREFGAGEAIKKVPIVGSLASLKEINDFVTSAIRLSDPDRYYDGDDDPQRLLDLHTFVPLYNKMSLSAVQASGIGTKTAGIIANLPTFVAEMALTKGAFKTCATVTTLATRKMLGGAGKSVVKRAIARVVGTLAGSAIQSTLMGHRALETAGRFASPDILATTDELGNIGVQLAEAGDSMALALWKGWLDNYVEVLTEHGGDAVPVIGKYLKGNLGGKVPPGLVTAMQKLVPSPGVRKVFKVMAEVGVHDPFTEYGEERMAAAIRAFTGLTDLPDDATIYDKLKTIFPESEQSQAELLAFLVLPAGGAVVGSVMGNRVDAQRETLLAMGLTPDAADRVLSVQETDQRLAQLSVEMDDTREQAAALEAQLEAEAGIPAPTEAEQPDTKQFDISERISEPAPGAVGEPPSQKVESPTAPQELTEPAGSTTPAGGVVQSSEKTTSPEASAKGTLKSETEPTDNTPPGRGGVGDFNLSGWLFGDDFEGIPTRPDKYTVSSNSLTYGKSVERGQAIQRGRSRKARKTNLDFFMREVFPKIRGQLNATQIVDVLRATNDLSVLEGTDIRLWEAGGKIAWLKEGDPKEAQARKQGATVVENPVFQAGEWVRGENGTPDDTPPPQSFKPPSQRSQKLKIALRDSEAHHKKVDRAAKRLARKYTTGIVTVRNVEGLPKDVRERLAEAESSSTDAKGLPRGTGVTRSFYDVKTDTTYLLSNKVLPEEVARAIVHETAVHGGLRALFGLDSKDATQRAQNRVAFRKVLTRVWQSDKAVSDALAGVAKRYGLDVSLKKDGSFKNPTEAYEAIEEAIAQLAENRLKNPTAWSSFVDAVEEFLRSIGLTVDTRSELDKILQQSMSAVRARRRALEKSDGAHGTDIRFSKTDDEYMAAVESGDTVKQQKMVDDNGNVIPLSERFNTGTPDIRFSKTDDEVQHLFTQRIEKDTQFIDEVRNALAKRMHKVAHNRDTDDKVLKILKESGLVGARRKFQSTSEDMPGEVRVRLGKALVQMFSKLAETSKTPEGRAAYAREAINTGIELDSIALRGGRTSEAYAGWSDSMATPESVTYYLAKLQREDAERLAQQIQPELKTLKKILPKTNQKITDQVLAARPDLPKAVKHAIRKHFNSSTGNTSLASKLEAAGLEAADAKKVAQEVINSFGKIAAQKKPILVAAALRKLDTKNPNRNLKTAIDALIALSNLGAVEDAEYLRVVARAHKLLNLTPDVMKKALELSKLIAEAPEDSAKRRDATTDLLAYIQKQRGPSITEPIWSLWYAYILSGHQTHERNLVHTMVNVLGNIMAMQLANTARNLKQHKTLAVQDSLRIWGGFFSGFASGWEEAKVHLSTGKSVMKGDVTKIDMPSTLESNPFTGNLTKILNKWKYVGRLLTAEDMLWYKPVYEARAVMLAIWAAREQGLSGNPLKEFVEKALARDRIEEFTEQAKNEGYTFRDPAGGWMKKAAVRVFRTDEGRRRVRELIEQNRADEVLSPENMFNPDEFAARATFNYQPEGYAGILADSLSKASKPIWPLRLVVPFTRIVANVQNSFLDWSPWGFVRAQTGMKTGYKTPNRQIMGEERATLYAKAILGTAFTAMMFMSGSGDDDDDDDDEAWFKVHGPGPRDPNKRNQLRNQNKGWKPYTLQFGDVYVSYLLSPFALIAATIGTMKDAERYEDMTDVDLLSRTAYVLLGAGRAMLSMGFLSSVAGLFDILSRESSADSAGRNVQRYLQRYAQSAVVPNVVAQIAKVYDPTLFETDTVVEGVIRVIPYANAASLRPRLNGLGDKIELDTGILWSRPPAKSDPTWAYLAKNKLWLPGGGNRFTLPNEKGEGVVVTDDVERWHYQYWAGRETRRLIERYKDSWDRQKLSTEQKQLQINSISRDARQSAKNKVLRLRAKQIEPIDFRSL